MIVETARAKVNLGLAVTGRRPDGYHALHTVFATLDLADRVTLAKREKGITLSVLGPYPLPAGGENLAYRAAEAYLAAAGWPGGVGIRLEKTIPPGAGLGGGSADAAAVLRGLARLYPAPVDPAALARKLGADVPFLLKGGLAEARGVGEVIQPLRPLKAHLVLIKPPLAVPTARVYAALSPRDFGPELDVAAILTALKAGLPPPWRNDLEKPAFRLFPELAELKRCLTEQGHTALMSGSGSAFLIPVEGAAEARTLASRLRARFPDHWVRPASLEV